MIEMPFEVVRVADPRTGSGESYAIKKLSHKGKPAKLTAPRYREEATAISVAKRWTEFRNRIPEVVRRDGRILILHA